MLIGFRTAGLNPEPVPIQKSHFLSSRARAFTTTRMSPFRSEKGILMAEDPAKDINAGVSRIRIRPRCGGCRRFGRKAKRERRRKRENFIVVYRPYAIRRGGILTHGESCKLVIAYRKKETKIYRICVRNFVSDALIWNVEPKFDNSALREPVNFKLTYCLVIVTGFRARKQV